MGLFGFWCAVRLVCDANCVADCCWFADTGSLLRYVGCLVWVVWTAMIRLRFGLVVNLCLVFWFVVGLRALLRLSVFLLIRCCVRF